MLKERWPLILFITTIVVSAPFWHELLPDEHYDVPAEAVGGRSPQAIFVFDTDRTKDPKADAPWKIASGPLAFEALQWLGAPSQEVGCQLEKALEQKLPPHGCADQPAKPGDPCVERTLFYAGPRFPRVKANKLHPAAMDVLLDWEGAKLREMTLRLHSYLTEADAKRLIQLPAELTAVPADGETTGPKAAFSKCGSQVCLTLTAFAHVDTSVCQQEGAK